MLNPFDTRNINPVMLIRFLSAFAENGPRHTGIYSGGLMGKLARVI